MANDVLKLISSAGDAERPAPVPLRRLLLLSDLLALVAGWAVVVVVAAASTAQSMSMVMAVARGTVVVAGGMLLLAAAGLYRRRICAIRAVEVARIGRVVLVLAVVTLLVVLDEGVSAALWSAAAGAVAWFAVLIAERGLFRGWIQVRRASGDFGASVLVVGGDCDSTRRTAALLSDNPALGFEVRGLVCRLAAGQVVADDRYLGDPEGLVEYARQAGVSGVVLDAGSLTGEQLNEHVRRLRDAEGVHVHISSGLRGVDRRRITVSPLADETFLHVAPIELTRLQERTKRTVDVVVGSLVLLAMSPVLLGSMALIWITDRGPVLCREQRVGFRGERFITYSLRTAVLDAEGRATRLVDGEARLTPIGRFLRNSSLDELPQLVNVVQGTMSLVGPRPTRPEQTDSAHAAGIERRTIKPGATGLWKIEDRDRSCVDFHRRCDLLYVQNWTLGLDLAIIARTGLVIFVRTVSAALPVRLRRGEATTVPD